MDRAAEQVVVTSNPCPRANRRTEHTGARAHVQGRTGAWYQAYQAHAPFAVTIHSGEQMILDGQKLFAVVSKQALMDRNYLFGAGSKRPSAGTIRNGE